ncbi:MAG TPA: hypothetical protein VFK13_14240 [Gemmatimonadaceae bacterium]|nr:hypothetical protein [Gemmatimonadaceae bacterium]
MSWRLLYTRARAEDWVEIQLRKHDFQTVHPRVRQRGGFQPLFPRYVIVGERAGWPLASLPGAPGILYVVHCGDAVACVPSAVVQAIRSRMDRRGVVHLTSASAGDALFARTQRERVRALLESAGAAVPRQRSAAR